jgi:hypothetical protein
MRKTAIASGLSSVTSMHVQPQSASSRPRATRRCGFLPRSTATAFAARMRESACPICACCACRCRASGGERCTAGQREIASGLPFPAGSAVRARMRRR